MRPFAYRRASRLEDALGLLAGDGETRPLAGGTDLLPLMKAGLLAPRRLVDLTRLPGLGEIREEASGSVELGALVTLARIETSATLRARFPILTEAAALAATPQLRNVATLGGNLLQRPRCWYFRHALFDCWLKGGPACPARDGENRLHALFGDGPCYAVHPSDLAPALLALGAEARIGGPRGERREPLDALFRLPADDRRTESRLGPDELILGLRLPAPGAGTRGTYLKAMDRRLWAFALVAVAAVVRLEGGRIADARLVLGGVAPIPWRAGGAEALLRGGRPEPALVDRAAAAALAGAEPLARNAYKVPLARALVARALRRLTGAPFAVPDGPAGPPPASTGETA